MTEKYSDAGQATGPTTGPVPPDNYAPSIANPAPDGTQPGAMGEKLPIVDDKPALPPRRSAIKQPDGLGDDKQKPPRYSTDSNRSLQSDEASGDFGATEPVSDNLPEATHPTIAFIIPFPTLQTIPEKHKDKIPPFVMYAPLAAALSKPAEGEKESITHKAMRKWQEEEREARKDTSERFKSKAVKLIAKGMSVTKNSRIEFLVRTPNKKKLKELRIVYPASYDAEDIKQRFADLVKSAKNGAIRNGIISSAMLPFVLAFDVVTFIAGPFEINAVWAASSWTGAARASAISSRITSDQLPISLGPDQRLNAVSYRLHEICWRKLKKPRTVMGDAPQWPPDAGPLRRGPDLAGQMLEVLRDRGEDMDDVEMDRRIVSEDLERCLTKGAKEWAKLVNE